jgi:3-oxoacyl-[acyl-carrier protein] reductase
LRSAANDRSQPHNYLGRADEAEKTCSAIKDLGRKTVAVQADVSVSREVARMVASIERGLGTIQVLVNNAGIVYRGSIDHIPEEDWDRVIDVNLKSAFLVTQAVLPGMRNRRWGRIINILSVAAQTGGITAPPYVSSKAGLWGLTHSCATLLVKEGITVNTVAPILIATDMITGDLKATPDRIPLGRFGTVEEVADVVVMLVKNGYMTGQTVSVNGGWYFT